MSSTSRTRQIYLWHKWTGLITGLFIFIATLTGTIAVFKNEIDAWVTPGRQVKPAGARAPLENVLKTMTTAYPRSRVGQIFLADGPTDVHRISIKDGKQSREVFINPYTAAISGSRVGENLANVIRQTHVRLYYFKWQGRVFVGFMGLMLLASSLTGVMIYAPFMKKLAFGQVRWNRGRQIALSDLHKLVGILMVVFNVVIGVTGAVLGLENLARFSPPVGEVLHPKPSEQARKQVPDTLKSRLTVDEAVAMAERTLPHFEVRSVTLPRAEKAHWMLRGSVKDYFTAAGTTWVMLDTHTGAMIETHDARRAGATTQAYNVSEPLHFGDFAGMPLKIAYALFGLLTSALYVTGVWIWVLKRRPSRARKARPAKKEEASASRNPTPEQPARS